MFRSIKWRFAIIYFILVFIALIIAGIFIVQSFKSYNVDNVTNKLGDLSDIILPKIEQVDQFEPEKLEEILVIQKNLGFNEEIYIINSEDKIIATNTENDIKYASEFLEINLLAEARNGNHVIKEIQNANMATMDLVKPIYKNKIYLGTLYIRYNLQSMYKTLSESTMIIIRAIFAVTLFTVILGYFIARNISEPIEEITSKVLKLSEGNFDQKVEVHSEDEIGDLANIFNLLTQKLQFNIKEVTKEKSKMEAIIEFMNDGLVALNMSNEIMHINSRAKKLLNVDSDNFEEKIKWYLDTENLLSNELLEGQKMISVNDTMLKVDYVPFEGDQGEKKGLVFVLRDVTEREKLDKMRKAFVANVSHELKTPLTSIKSYSETLIRDEYDKDITKRFLNVINEEADRMNRLVKDLLQLSNFDSAAIDLNITYSNYVDLIENILLKLKPSYMQKSQEVVFDTVLEEAIGPFDYDRIEQLFINIISNAIKYTPDHGEVDIILNEVEDHYVLKIEDSGIGIPEEDLANIFERFYRVDKARSRKLGGTGLGLSIAKEIAELHNGNITINSAIDEGTEVIIELPKNLDAISNKL